MEELKEYGQVYFELLKHIASRGRVPSEEISALGLALNLNEDFVSKALDDLVKEGTIIKENSYFVFNKEGSGIKSIIERSMTWLKLAYSQKKPNEPIKRGCSCKKNYWIRGYSGE